MWLSRVALIFEILEILRYIPVSCEAVSGVIWSKSQQEFVGIFSVPQFALLRKEIARKSRGREMYDMRGVIVRATYYEDRNMAVFYDNDTKLTGICGEIWNTLTDVLNFTLIPIKYPEKNFGDRLANGSYNGLMGLLQRNETDVILRAGYYLFRTGIIDYTTPVWKTKYHLYIRPRWGHENTWMITLFKPQTWYMIICLFVVLSVFGFILQGIPNRYNKESESYENFNLQDHIFYTFAMMCSQGHVPDSFHNRFKILSFSKSIFSWLILLAFSSHLIYRMTNKLQKPPFTNFETLFNHTTYNVVARKGSMVYESLKVRLAGYSSRVRFVGSEKEMYSTICYDNKNDAIVEVDDKYMASKRQRCQLLPAGESFYQTWVTFAMPKNYEYKRTLDVAIIKLHEVGLVQALRGRWLNSRAQEIMPSFFRTVDLEQVHIIFLILCFGLISSLVIFVIENFIFAIEQRYSQKNRMRKKTRFKSK